MRTAGAIFLLIFLLTDLALIDLAYDAGKRAGEAEEKPCTLVDVGYAE